MNKFLNILRPFLFFESLKRYTTNLIVDKEFAKINYNSSIEDCYNILATISQEKDLVTIEYLKNDQAFERLLTRIKRNISVLTSSQISNLFNICDLMNFPCEDITQAISHLICQGQLFPSSNLIKIIIKELFCKIEYNNPKIVEIVKSELLIKPNPSQIAIMLKYFINDPSFFKFGIDYLGSRIHEIDHTALPNFFEALTRADLINSKEFFMLIESFKEKLNQMDDSIIINIIKIMEKHNILSKYILNILAHEISNRLDKSYNFTINHILVYISIFIDHDKLEFHNINRLQSLFFSNIKNANTSEMLDMIVLQLSWNNKYIQKNKNKSKLSPEFDANVHHKEFTQYSKAVIELIISHLKSEELYLGSNKQTKEIILAQIKKDVLLIDKKILEKLKFSPDKEKSNSIKNRNQCN